MEASALPAGSAAKPACRNQGRGAWQEGTHTLCSGHRTFLTWTGFKVLREGGMGGTHGMRMGEGERAVLTILPWAKIF